MFHYNTLLTLDLASPYFSSGRQEERFEVIVMEHKEDGHVRLGDRRFYSKLGITMDDKRLLALKALTDGMSSRHHG